MSKEYHDRGAFKQNYRSHANRSIDSEYSHIYKQDRRIQGEKRFLGALLERAIADALYSPGRHPGKSSMKDAIQASKKHSRQAYQWIIGKPNPLKPPICTFEWVCSGLDLNPEALRAIVIKARHETIKFNRQGGKGGSNNKLRLCVNE